MNDYNRNIGYAEGGKGVKALTAKNPLSSASGKYQFLKDTWKSLGGQWGSNPNLAFGGLNPSEAEQDYRQNKFTQRNADYLRKSGVTVNSAALSAAHFLGAGGAAKILKAHDDTPINSLITSKEYAANKSVFNNAKTVGGFKKWAAKRVGGTYNYKPSTPAANTFKDTSLGINAPIKPFNPAPAKIERVMEYKASPEYQKRVEDIRKAIPKPVFDDSFYDNFKNNLS